jgi:hypothetical protein
MFSRIQASAGRASSRRTRLRYPVTARSIVSWFAIASLSGCAGRPDPTVAEAYPTTLELPVASDIAPPALTRGWIDFLNGLGDARRAVEDPALFPPAPTDRNLAEGYRYLLGHLARIIEAETQGHPDFPYFQRYVRMLSKWTVDNPDAMYLSSPIDADGVYIIRGRSLDASAWRTSERAQSGQRAPRVLIFQTTTASIGQTGRLAEMRECRNKTLDSIDQFDLELDREGRFKILVAATKPARYDGHFLTSRTELPCATPFGTTTYRSRNATRVNVREIFSDWDDEVPVELEIIRLDMRGAPRPPRTSAEMGLHLGEIGRRLANQIEFWNLFHEFALEVKGDRDADGRMALPLNDMNQPSPPFVAGGTAGSGQLYAAGIYELDADEALVVRVEAPIEPHYVGFQLGNLWGESLDQANFVSSATGTQNPVSSDGARYYVVSERDPGTPGWINTTGLSKVTMSMRFIFRENPPRSEMPTIKTYATKIANVRDHLPPDTPKVSPNDRRHEVDRRQRHIQRRWRQY